MVGTLFKSCRQGALYNKKTLMQYTLLCSTMMPEHSQPATKAASHVAEFYHAVTISEELPLTPARVPSLDRAVLGTAANHWSLLKETETRTS
mmetsp:Transcript_39361/g.58639  ORF Transcript_39361/g.58639 Transcript_39361/m.58639 type:complete len:92 (-) Transcript_39361:53-328(-)